MAANLSFLKRLIKEDFPQKDQDLVGKIGFILNPAIQQIVTILNHGMAISDLNTQIKDITVIVDSSGNPTTETSFLSTLSGKCGMLQVGRAQNLTNTATYPTSGHSISYSEKNGLIVINNITGLTANDKWQLRLVAYV